MFELNFFTKGTFKWLPDTSIKTMKYLNAPEERLIGPQISPWIQCRDGGNSLGSYYLVGFLVKFLWIQAMTSCTFWASDELKLWPRIKGSILRNTVNSKCPSLGTISFCLAVVYINTFFTMFRPLSRGPSAQAAIQTVLLVIASITSLYRPSSPAWAVAGRLCPCLSSKTKAQMVRFKKLVYFCRST